MKRVGSLFFVLIVSLAGTSQINVRQITAGSEVGDRQGIFYSLPATYIKVTVDVYKTEYLSGPYAAYAAKYLGAKDVITSDYSEYSIVGASMEPLSVPDANQVFFAEITDKAAKEQRTVLLSLAETGLVSDIRGNLPGKPVSNIASLNVVSDPANKEIFNYFAETNLYEKYDTIIRKVVVDTMTVEKIYLDKKLVGKSDEQKAIEAANKISKIREARINLLTGYQEVAYDAGTMAYMDKELIDLEKEIMSLFTGIAYRKSFQYSFIVKPEDPKEPLPVFVFSERSGVKNADASGGEKIMLQMELLNDLAEIQNTLSKRNGANSENRGFFYRIPVMTKVILNLNNDLRVESLIPVSQFGSVTYLPPTVTSVQFYQETGGVKTLFIN